MNISNSAAMKIEWWEVMRLFVILITERCFGVPVSTGVFNANYARTVAISRKIKQEYVGFARTAIGFLSHQDMA
jgi:hypothetical protein